MKKLHQLRSRSSVPHTQSREFVVPGNYAVLTFTAVTSRRIPVARGRPVPTHPDKPGYAKVRLDEHLGSPPTTDRWWMPSDEIVCKCIIWYSRKFTGPPTNPGLSYRAEISQQSTRRPPSVSSMYLQRARLEHTSMATPVRSLNAWNALDAVTRDCKCPSFKKRVKNSTLNKH